MNRGEARAAQNGFLDSTESNCSVASTADSSEVTSLRQNDSISWPKTESQVHQHVLSVWVNLPPLNAVTNSPKTPTTAEMTVNHASNVSQPKTGKNIDIEIMWPLLWLLHTKHRHIGLIVSRKIYQVVLCDSRRVSLVNNGIHLREND